MSGGASAPVAVHTLLTVHGCFSTPPEQVYLCAESLFSTPGAHDHIMRCPW